MSPPILVVEVVSPGELQRDRDYIATRMQYQDRCIPKYWIIDPQRETILILELIDGNYTEVDTFTRDARIHSLLFPALALTAAQILAAGV
jgi:Uma2 family endonuclease